MGENDIFDFPFDGQPDVAEFLRAAMRWHFGERTGSPFWLDRVGSLEFDPTTEITSFDDLRQFPDVSSDLREVRVTDLIPRGYGNAPEIIAAFESGGTTGPPKRIVFLRDWLERLLSWMRYDLGRRGIKAGQNWLAAVPGRPHMIGGFSDHEAEAFEAIKFSIDMDPRWVKKLIAAGDTRGADAYGQHLVDQVEHILRTQDVEVLLVSPPMLERIARRPELVALVQQRIKHILWGGTHMDADSRRLYRTEIFPGMPMTGAYGSTTFLGACKERLDAGEDECIYDGVPLHITFAVVDADTHERVAYGERGRVLSHHISRSMLLPNVLERDTAVRHRALTGQEGDALGDVSPLDSVSGREVIEGVY